MRVNASQRVLNIRLCGHRVRGRELTQASTSWSVVSSSPRVRHRAPTVFLRAVLMDRINFSHHPPNQGESGTMNFHLGATGPNCFCNSTGLAMKPLALSEYKVCGSPRRAARRRKASTVSGVDKDSTNSIWTARTTAHVNSKTQNFFLGRSQQYRGPAWSNPVTSKGKAWLTLSAGKGAIGCEQAGASWRWQEIHAFLTCLAMRLKPIIQNSLRKEDIICGTPACFNKQCWNLVKRTLKWHLGRIMGCFSAWDNAENCNRPCIRNKPSSPRNGVNLASADVLGIGRPSFKALIS